MIVHAFSPEGDFVLHSSRPYLGALMRENLRTTPQATGVLVVDEIGDRRDRKATTHVGKQYLATNLPAPRLEGADNSDLQVG